MEPDSTSSAPSTPDAGADELEATGTASTKPSIGRGTLSIKAPLGLLFQLDRNPFQMANKKSFTLPAGTHRVTSFAGTQEIVIADNQTTVLQLAESPIDQTFHSGIQAYERKEYDNAKKLFERASVQCTRDRPHATACAGLAVALAMQRGRLFEEQKQWAEAMTEYQKVVQPSSRGKLRSSLMRVEAQEAIVRIAPRLGQVVLLGTDKKARKSCTGETIWLLPGKQSVKVDGKRQTVNVRAGDIIRLGACL